MILRTITNMEERIGGEMRPARLVAPGRILRRELEARGWTQKDWPWSFGDLNR